MEVNYVLMYGTPYLKYREFETFEDVSKFLINKGIVNYSIFKKLEDKEEVEMIYRDNDIAYLKGIIKEVREYIKDHTTHYTSYLGREHKVVPKIELQREAYDKLLEILRGEE